jgi:hypothetical protein
MNDDEFDAAARRILRGLPVPASVPVHLPRRRFLRRGLAALGLAAVGTTAWVTASYAAMPRLVKLSARHVAEEAMLRGVLVSDLTPVHQALSWPVGAALPGIVQMCKDCAIGPYPAWHLQVFMDNLGMVQLIAFRAPIPDAAGQGSWLDQHWRFLPAAQGPLLLLSPHRAALDLLATRLQRGV